MIIALSGLPGAGKSTIKNLLAARLGLQQYSMGDLRGKMAQERGMTIDEFNALGMQEAFTDKDADAFQEKLGQTEDNFVIDGWLSWHFIPRSFKIFLEIDPRAGAERIFAAHRHEAGEKDEPAYTTVEETMETITRRVAQTHARYQKWYDLDFLDRSHYDIVIDTTHITPEQVIDRILSALPSA